MKITLLTPYVSTNRLHMTVAGGRKVLTTRARASKEALAWEAKIQCTKKEPRKGPIRAQIDLYVPDNRKRDLDNIKGLIDAMTGILWVDDSQIVDLHITKTVDRENPRVVISL